MLLEDHHAEQLLLYDVRSALLEARTFPGDAGMAMVADELDEIRDSLRAHFELEEEEVLPQVPLLFDDDEQGRLLRTILSSVPDDPRLQPWVVSGLSPEHRAARLRNLSASLPPAALEDGPRPDPGRRQPRGVGRHPGAHARAGGAGRTLSRRPSS